MKILIIAYYYPPYRGVGAIRPAYWHQRLMLDGFDSYVITATKQEVKEKKIIYVEPISRKRALIKDQGTNWSAPLIQFFKHFDVSFDFVLFTGGPFMHFSVASMFRRQYPSTKIILDFRDPFAQNPRFKNSWLKIRVKRFYEKRFIKNADEIVTVNRYCASLIDVNPDKCTIIDNGFDERIVYTSKKYKGPLIDDGKINFVYAGNFAQGYGDPTIFINAISRFSDRMKFHHLGNESHNFSSIYKTAIKHGMKSYAEAISIMKVCDVGLIFTSGLPYESTTKVFDYMACNLDILIISDLGNTKGALHKITEAYPKVTWIENDLNSLVDYLRARKNRDIISLPTDIHQFSRDAGYKKLLKLIE